MAQVTPLRPEDEDVEAVREVIRLGRRRLAWRLFAAGGSLCLAGAVAVWRSGRAHDAVAGDAASATFVSLVLAAAGLAAAIGLGLVGTAVFVLLSTRPGPRSG